MSWIFVLTY